MQQHYIKLSSPAKNWEHGTPIGGGSFGAMLLGATDTEKIYLCEETIWSGEEKNTTSSDFKNKISIMRQMYLDGKLSEIDQWAQDNLTQGIERINSYEYAGVLNIDYHNKESADNYVRQLHLNSAIAEISYTKGNNKIKETAFCSYADETTAVKIEADCAISYDLFFERENTESITFINDLMLIRAKTQFSNNKFAVGIKIETDGDISYKNNKVTVKNAYNTVLFIAVATEFNFDNEFEAICLDILSEADDFNELKNNHVEDFSELFNKSDISFNSEKGIEDEFTDIRLNRLKSDKNYSDNALYSLYFAFGKYLMISSSREDTLPANLQGVWVEKAENPWNSDYHTNINLQMNYWLCEVANLSSCHMPLFEYMNNYLLDSGKKTAKENYNCRGTVLHHLSNIYGFTTPADGLWGVWPMGAAWLSFHMWEHYLFTKDVDFLKNTAYDYIHQCVLFFIDFLFEDKNGNLISGPSMSPENKYYPIKNDKTKQAHIAFSPTMDVEIIGGLFRNYIEAEKILNINPSDKQTAENVLKKLPPLKVGKNGCLMEWLKDYEEVEPGHRHISHAFALYPDNAINENTPELLAAVKNTIDRRLSFGGGHTGWSRAWLINLFARIKNGEKTYEHIRLLLEKSTLSNLLDVHPPFQIDGNFGGAAGIAESLIQSHENCIHILPAADKSISGSFSHLLARGCIDISAEFIDGKVTKAVLFTPFNQLIKLKINGEEKEMQLNAKEILELVF